jgi:hypothetical protein
MKTMIRVAIACSATLAVAACSKGGEAAKDTTTPAAAAAPAPPPAPAPFSMADAAGQWDVSAVPESGTDTSATKYVLTATADTTGWVIAFPSGVKVPLHVMASGDSLITKTGVFPSQRRKGAKVMTETVLRMSGGKLTGTSIAHYQNAGADSVVRLRTEGTKKP